MTPTELHAFNDQGTVHILILPAGKAANAQILTQELAGDPVHSLTRIVAPAAKIPPPTPQPKGATAPANQRAGYDLVAPPSMTAAQIDAVLAQYGSPAAGTGAAFYALGVEYGIDPA